MTNIPAITGLILIHLMLFFGMGVSNLGSFIDIPSLQIVLGVTVASAFVTSPLRIVKGIPGIIKYGFFPNATDVIKPKTFKELKPYLDMFESMSRVAVGAGIVGTLIALILLLGNMSDIDSIGPNMAVALITLLYGAYYSELLIQPIKRMIISTFESSEELEQLHKDQLAEHLEHKGKSTRPELLLIAVFLPILVFFILLVSLADGPWSKEEPSIWEKNRVTSLSISSIKINGISASQFVKPSSCDSSMPFTFTVENGEDSLYIAIDTSLIEQINSAELISTFMIHDSRVQHCEENGIQLWFRYPVSLREERTILYENDSLSLQFTISPVFDTLQEL